MNKRYFLIGLKFSTLIIAFHLVANGYVKIENYLAGQVEEARKNVYVTIVNSFDLEPKKAPEAEVDLMQFTEQEALRQGVNPAYARAVLKVETRGRAYAISPKGAIGPMQIMPANYKRCKLEHPGKLYDEKTNIRCGIQILKEELITYNSNLIKASKAYNGGPNCVKNKCSESEAYWPKIAEVILLDTPGLG